MLGKKKLSNFAMESSSKLATGPESREGTSEGKERNQFYAA